MLEKKKGNPPSVVDNVNDARRDGAEVHVVSAPIVVLQVQALARVAIASGDKDLGIQAWIDKNIVGNLGTEQVEPKQSKIND